MATSTRKTPAAALPAAPPYGSRTIAELLPSAAAALGVEGFGNPLGLPKAKRTGWWATTRWTRRAAGS